MLRDESVAVKKPENDLSQEKIVVGEVANTDDLDKWLSIIDNSWMLVGAGDFYERILASKFQQVNSIEDALLSPHLYICGTAFAERKQFIKEIARETGCVLYLPDIIDESWLKKAGTIVKANKKLVVAIDHSSQKASQLRLVMAKAAKEIILQEHIQEVFIEGGSTAAAILNELNIRQLIPVNELERGVVRMKTNELYVTVKPGSYPLPAAIQHIYSPK
jgi:hypothetical protein